MYHLVSSLWHTATHVEEYKVLVIGPGGAGKTSLVERVKGAFTPDARPPKMAGITPTVGLNIARLELHGAKLLFWDMGGDAALQPLWRNYYHQCHAVMFVVDAADEAGLAGAAPLIQHLFTLPALMHTPILIVVNKCDKDGALPVAAAMDRLALLDTATLPRNYETGAGHHHARQHSMSTPPPSSTGDAHAGTGGGGGGGGTRRSKSPGASPLMDFSVTPEVSGTSGIGGRAFRVIRADAMAVGGGPELAGGIKWLVDFLLLNARGVATL
jgi:ADP-ribosylation factor related protein 1